VNFHEDDRAQRLFDVFSEVNGQINISHVNSTGHVVAWHKHKVQTDYWFCVKGSFKVGLAFPKDDGYEVRWEYLSDKFPRTLTIPPGVYHGYKALQPESTILYYLSEEYDPEDEWKVLPGHFGESWETDSK
jgi:dTDP-4-dehydrorhamnose 3,5-epimerase|tara:strand:- start:13705 stop:14097 length:393 start_codon:yes stop_codon:yes gene_type:complete